MIPEDLRSGRLIPATWPGIATMAVLVITRSVRVSQIYTTVYFPVYLLGADLYVLLDLLGTSGPLNLLTCLGCMTLSCLGDGKLFTPVTLLTALIAVVNFRVNVAENLMGMAMMSMGVDVTSTLTDTPNRAVFPSAVVWASVSVRHFDEMVILLGDIDLVEW